MISGCSNQEKLYSKDLMYMDTYINVKIYSNDKALTEKALKNVESIYKEYDKLSDRYKSYDNVKNVNYINNKLGINQDLKIDDKLYDLLNYSKFYYDKTNGLFNIAMGNVIDVWAQYRKGEKKGIPTYNELKSSGSVNIKGLVLKEDDTISKTENISIDLGGIAKGYATELVGKYLDGVGLHKYLITAGTSSIKAGDHYKSDAYKIGLTNPNKTADLYKILKVKDMSVTTSGSYEQYYEYKGVRYHHLIDPNTLFPPNYTLTVTVITDNAALGEVLSKALFLMPIKDGLEYIKNYSNVEAIWYGTDGKITMTDGMKKYE